MISRNGVQERRKNLQAFVRTRLCRYFPLGKCTLGDTCKFAHDYTDLRNVPDFRKTRMCDMFFKGQCSLSDDKCAFAHAREELKVITDVYKTAICKHWSIHGTCRSGPQCRFAHGGNELRDRSESGLTLSADSMSMLVSNSTSSVDSEPTLNLPLDLNELLREDDNELSRIFAKYEERESRASTAESEQFLVSPLRQNLFFDNEIIDVHQAASAILAQLLTLKP